jgi:error-prone DNA polymerase
MEPFRQKLVEGMRSNGYSVDFADRVFRQIQGFGEYGFPESHAASFALLVYVSAWLKLYYPAAFAAALLNSQPMGFYAPAQLVADAKRHGVEVRPIDVNFSDWDCTLEPVLAFSVRSVQANAKRKQEQPALRLGLRLVHGLARAHAERIMQQRKPFTSLDDFARRTGLRSPALKQLARADAFRSLGLGRRAALWQALPRGPLLPLFKDMDMEEPTPSLPALAPLEEVLADYGSAGLTLRQHPMAFLRPTLDKLRVARADDLPDLKVNCRVKAAGVVLVRQRPSTANGITFVTLEDESGMINLIVRKHVWERYRRAARTAAVMLAHGYLQKEAGVIHILVTRLEDLSTLLADLGTTSRDFR